MYKNLISLKLTWSKETEPKFYLISIFSTVFIPTMLLSEWYSDCSVCLESLQM